MITPCDVLNKLNTLTCVLSCVSFDYTVYSLWNNPKCFNLQLCRGVF